MECRFILIYPQVIATGNGVYDFAKCGNMAELDTYSQIVVCVSAYYQHMRETINIISPRKLMYWLYAAVFFVAALANFTQLCVTLAFRSYQQASFHIGYSTLLLALSYLAVLFGVRRKMY